MKKTHGGGTKGTCEEPQKILKPDAIKALVGRLNVLTKKGVGKKLTAQNVADITAASNICGFVNRACEIGDMQIVRTPKKDTSLHNPELSKCIVSLCYESIVEATPGAREE